MNIKTNDTAPKLSSFSEQIVEAGKVKYRTKRKKKVTLFHKADASLFTVIF